MLLNYLVRGVPLISFNILQVCFPLARTLILARILSGFEFGFASALSASYSAFELITDIAIHRFVLASCRGEYKEALAAAHGLSILRGMVAGILAVAAAPGLAHVMSLSADWSSFAWLGPAIFIRSFEHFEVRVWERDYRYNAQLILNLVSNGTALAAMLGTWSYVADHTIYLTMLFAQNTSYVLASHMLAKNPYRLAFRSPHFRKATRFAYPLVFSGVGLALVSQGDRLLVGSVLDLQTLGVYSVIMSTVSVPIGGIIQISSSLVLAGLHNAAADRERFHNRLLLYMRLALVAGLLSAFGLLGFMQVILPFVFGSRFTVTKSIVALLAGISFLTLARAEPTTSVLLVNHRTRTLATVSLSVVAGLVFSAAFALTYHNVYAVLWGRIIGDVVAFGLSMTILRGYVKEFGARPFIWSLWAGAWLAITIILYVYLTFMEATPLRLGVLAVLAMLSIGGLAIHLRPMTARAYNHSR